MFNEGVVITEHSTEVVPLTLEISKHYDRMATLLGDRNPDSPRGKTRVAYLYNLLRSGLFHSPVWSTVQVASEKGKKYRVDGGHSSRMLTQAGADFPENLSVTVRSFRVPDIETAVYLYEQFNASFSTRTQTDLIKNRAAYEKQLRNIAPTYIGRALYGIACHFSLRNPGEPVETLDYISMYPDFIKQVSEVIKKRHMQLTGVVGTMFSTWATSKSLSNEFWRMVNDESSPEPECPTRILAKFLMKMTLDKNQAMQWPKRAIYVKCHHAWNAWRTGEGTRLKYVHGAPLPDPK